MRQQRKKGGTPGWIKWSAMAVLWASMTNVSAQEPLPTWKINMKEAEIRTLIEQVADITGDSFVVDPRVKGRVTVVSNTEMTEEEILQMFESVLRVHNFSSVRTGKMVKIIPTQGAKQDSVPLEEADAASDKMITQVIPVKFANATELVPILRPQIPQYGHLAAVTSSNSLIISDHSANVQRILDIVRDLDKDANEEVEVIQLKHAWCADMVKILEQIAGGAKAGGAPGVGTPGRVKVMADERANRLVVQGENSARQKIRVLISDLDRPAEHSIRTEVLYLDYADAFQIAEVLRGIVTGQTGGAAGMATPGGFGAAGMARSGMGGMGAGSTGFGNAGMGGFGSSGLSGGGLGSGSTTGFGAAQSQQRPTSTPIQAGNITIQADDSLNALVVRAAPPEMAEIKSLVKQLDIRRSQVLIEAAIVEVKGESGKAAGIQFAQADRGQMLAGSNFSTSGLLSIDQIIKASGSSDTTQTPPSLANGLTLGGGDTNSDGDVEFALIVQAVNNASNTNLLSTPSIVTMDNEEAEILVGQNVPFQTGSQLNQTGNPFNTFERKDIGVILKVIPQVNKGKNIRLRVMQEASSIDTISTASLASDLITNKRTINTSVLAQDGEVIVLGGLMQDNVIDTVQKVPLLGDIPLIGALFRSSSKSVSKSNLLLFLRPTVINDAEDADAVTQRKYSGIRNYRMGLDSVEQIEIDTNLLGNENAGEFFNRVDSPVMPIGE